MYRFAMPSHSSEVRTVRLLSPVGWAWVILASVFVTAMLLAGG